MEIVLAKTAGFCFGVNRAIETVFSLLEQGNKNIFTLGPIIHNDQMVGHLKDLGVNVINEVEEIGNIDTALPSPYVVIRAHGVSPYIYDIIMEKNLIPVDATCPYVKKIHNIVMNKYKEGYKIIIVGDKKHPEVIGINGWCDNQAIVLDNIPDVNKLDFNDESDERVFVVAQTTFNHNKWVQILERLKEKFTNMEKQDTICSATIDRQREAKELSEYVDMMLVIGGRNSSNTQKLFDICKKKCKNTYKIETYGDIPPINIKEIKKVGITAGASTPDWIIKEVLNKMDELKKQDDARILEEPIEKEDPVEQEKLETQQELREEQELNKKDKEEMLTQDMQQNVPDMQQNVPEKTEITDETEVEAIEEKETEVTAEAEATAETKVDTVEEEAKTKDQINFEEAVEDSMVTLRSGEVVKGKIIGFGDEEIFVDLGYKCDGIIPFNELSNDPNIEPREIFKEGMEIDVYIVKVNDGEGNVSLSKKRIDVIKGWEAIENGFKNKEAIRVKVTDIIKGGILTESRGIRIFIPASQVSDRYITNFNEFTGKEFDIRIIELNRNKNKIVGSRRILIEEEKERLSNELWSSIEVDKKYIGKVKNLTKFGAFVDLGGVDGLVHVSELSWQKIKHPSEVVNVGDEVEVIVLEFDREKQRISLGYKKERDNPWVKIGETYQVGDIVKGKVVRLVPFGCFVQIQEHVDGLVHISQISNKRIAKPDEVLEVNQEVEAMIVEMDLENKKIGLSIKEVNPIDPIEPIDSIEPIKETADLKKMTKSEIAPAPKKEEEFPLEHKEELQVKLGDVFGKLNFEIEKED